MSSALFDSCGQDLRNTETLILMKYGILAIGWFQFFRFSEKAASCKVGFLVCLKFGFSRKVKYRIVGNAGF